MCGTVTVVLVPYDPLDRGTRDGSRVSYDRIEAGEVAACRVFL